MLQERSNALMGTTLPAGHRPQAMIDTLLLPTIKAACSKMCGSTEMSVLLVLCESFLEKAAPVGLPKVTEANSSLADRAADFRLLKTSQINQAAKGLVKKGLITRVVRKGKKWSLYEIPSLTQTLSTWTLHGLPPETKKKPQRPPLHVVPELKPAAPSTPLEDVMREVTDPGGYQEAWDTVIEAVMPGVEGWLLDLLPALPLSHAGDPEQPLVYAPSDLVADHIREHVWPSIQKEWQSRTKLPAPRLAVGRPPCPAEPADAGLVDAPDRPTPATTPTQPAPPCPEPVMAPEPATAISEPPAQSAAIAQVTDITSKLQKKSPRPAVKEANPNRATVSLTREQAIQVYRFATSQPKNAFELFAWFVHTLTVRVETRLSFEHRLKGIQSMMQNKT
jgi:hypothetical protein